MGFFRLLENIRTLQESSRVLIALVATVIMMAGVITVWVYSFSLNGETLLVDRSPEIDSVATVEAPNSIEDLTTAIKQVGDQVGGGFSGIQEQLSEIRDGFESVEEIPAEAL